jgi:hypothetical protein
MLMIRASMLNSAERMIYMKSLTIAAFIVLCCNFSNTLAQDAKDTCSPSIYKAIKRDLKLEKLWFGTDRNYLVSSACKAWPYKGDLLLVALAYDEGVKYERKQVIAVIDKKMRVVSSSVSDIYEDAMTQVGESSFKLDTARYQLANDIRAFGVIFKSSAHGANCASGYFNDTLTLYIPNEEKLKPVITIYLYKQQWLAGCPASANNVPSFWEDAGLTLGMANSSTNGFRDILVTAKIEVNGGDEVPKEFKNRKNRTEQRVMKFDGKTYKSTKEAWWLGNF